MEELHHQPPPGVERGLGFHLSFCLFVPAVKEPSVIQKMQTIQHTFLAVQDVFFNSPEWEKHLSMLESADMEFRSIAYESASMSIALEDFKQGEQLNLWTQFLSQAASAHATQVYVGLGWALAQTLKNPMLYLPALNPMLRYRVLDGYGYYEGVFRRRRTVINQLKLAVDDVVASGALDQGLGRSMWYHSRGVFSDAKATIEGFAAERQKDLWRGLGIAIAYVGGCTDDQLFDIFSETRAFQPQLAAGALMAQVSRNESGCVSADTQRTAELWWGINEVPLAEALALNRKNELLPNAYQNWVAGIEQSFTERAS